MGPETRYAYAGEVAIGYQVSGTGSVPLVLLLPIGNIDLMRESMPRLEEFLDRLGDFARLICYDKRGTGVSDRRVDAPTLDERVEDVLAVMDEIAVDRAAMFGVSEGGSLAAYIGATHPDRVSSVVMWGTPSRFVRDEGHPWGLWTREESAAGRKAVAATWGTSEGALAMMALQAPSMTLNDHDAERVARFQRASLSRDAILGHHSIGGMYDLADVFPAVRVPTLVMHRVDDQLVPIAQGRRLAEVMPNARLVELEGDAHLPMLGDTEAVLGELEHFLTGQRSITQGQRRLLSLLMTDIVGSTEVVASLGDNAWETVLTSFDDHVRHCLARFGGTEVKQTGDGFLATFDGPGRAIDCAVAIVEGTDRLGLDVRTGIHTGECELHGEDVAGIAVHVAARLTEQADPGQILASGTVRDLVAGSGTRFGPGVEVELQGLAGRRVVHEVLHHGASRARVRSLLANRRAELSHEGEYWTASFDEEVAVLRHSAGLSDLSRLLERPGGELHVLDLSAPEGAAGLAPSVRTAVIDDQARAAYRQRLNELEAEADEAAAANDTERKVAVEAEHDTLVAELTAAYGLAGRDRSFGEEAERARKAVSKRIRSAIDKIEEAHESLGRHLHATIRTGTYCAYQPDPVVHWVINR